jgi:hypothetical protein
MLEISLSIIFLASLMGMFFMVKKKLPILANLSSVELSPVAPKEETFSKKSLFLQKVLSKFRILVLKTDNKTNEWLKELRKRSLENKTKFSESYWDNLKK